MATFTQTDAKEIARKLKCTFDPDRAKSHDVAELFEGGKLIARFGIRRASKEKSHNYIPRELHITQKQCWDFRRCHIAKEAYLEILREKGLL